MPKRANQNPCPLNPVYAGGTLLWRTAALFYAATICFCLLFSFQERGLAQPPLIEWVTQAGVSGGTGIEAHGLAVNSGADSYVAGIVTFSGSFSFGTNLMNAPYSQAAFRPDRAPQRDCR